MGPSWEGSGVSRGLELERRVFRGCGCAASHFLPSPGRGRGSRSEAAPASSRSPGGCDAAPAAAAGPRAGKPRGVKPRGVPGSRHLPTCSHRETAEPGRGQSWGTGTLPRYGVTAWGPPVRTCALPGGGPGWDRMWIRTPKCINSPSPGSLFPHCLKASLAPGCLTVFLLLCHPEPA